MSAKARIRLGAAVFSALLMLLFFFLWVKERGPFLSGHYELRATFDSGGGLLERAKVFLRGYNVGTLKSVEMTTDGVVCVLLIKDRYRVPEGSVFAVETLNLLGERAISIEPSASARFLPPGSLVQGSRSAGSGDAREVMDGLRAALERVRWEELEAALDVWTETWKALERRVEVLDLTEARQSLNRLAVAAETLQRSMDENFGKLESAAGDSRRLMSRLEEGLALAAERQARVDRLLERLEERDSVLGRAMDSPEFLKLLQDTLAGVRDFLADLEKNPRKYFKVTLF